MFVATEIDMCTHMDESMTPRQVLSIHWNRAAFCGDMIHTTHRLVTRSACRQSDGVHLSGMKMPKDDLNEVKGRALRTVEIQTSCKSQGKIVNQLS